MTAEDCLALLSFCWFFNTLLCCLVVLMQAIALQAIVDVFVVFYLCVFSTP